MESMKDYEKELERSFRKIKEGDILEGSIIAIDETEVTLDLNYYAPGVIKAENLSNDPGFLAKEELNLGDILEAKVLRLDDGHGNIELSRKEANDLLSWDTLKEMMEKDSIATVTVKEKVNKGLVTYLEGIRAFIPASHIGIEYVEDEDLDSFIGKKLEVKIITVDQDSQKLVLSARAVAREKKQDDLNHKISMLIPGTIMEGVVENIRPFGAFVNLGDGLSGLIHISQICQKRISSPYEVLKEGQKVKVKLLNTNEGKISLSMKALEEEMVDTQEVIEIEEFNSHEEVGTGLAGLLKGIKL